MHKTDLLLSKINTFPLIWLESQTTNQTIFVHKFDPRILKLAYKNPLFWTQARHSKLLWNITQNNHKAMFQQSTNGFWKEVKQNTMGPKGCKLANLLFCECLPKIVLSPTVSELLLKPPAHNNIDVGLRILGFWG